MDFNEEFETFDSDGGSNFWDTARQKAVQAYEFYEKGEMPSALEAIDGALEIDPQQSKWHFDKALALDACERFDEAVAEYKTALSFDDTDVEILNCLAVDYTRSGHYDLAIETFEHIEQLDAAYEPCFCNRIITYTEMGLYELAEESFYSAQQLDENCPLCFYNIGNMFFIKDDFKRAIWCWQKTCELEPSHPQINYHIAKAYWNLGDNVKARKHFVAELQLNSGNYDVIFDYGLFLLHSGDVDLAAEKFRWIVDLCGDYAPAVFYLGEVAFNRGDLVSAERYYQRALSLDAKLAGPRFRLGRICFNRGDYEQAFEYLSTELSLDIDNVDILTAIGLMCQQMGNFDYAVHCFLKATESDELSGANYFNLAKSLYLRGEYSDSQQFLDYAAELSPDDSALIFACAQLSYEMGNFTNARLMLSGLCCSFSGFAYRRLQFMLWLRGRLNKLGTKRK